MKINYQNLLHCYNESGQKNSLRWMCLQKTAEDSYKNTTNIFKCKDYFNDFVAYKHLGSAAKFEVYGMPSTAATFTEEGGLYVLLGGCKKNLVKNVENVINKEFKDSPWHVQLTLTEVKRADVSNDPDVGGVYYLLYLPPEALKNTFRISLLTMLIRNCNSTKLYPDFLSIIDRDFITDGHLRKQHYDMLRKKEFYNIADAYVYYYNPQSNSSKVEHPANIVHNCGVVYTTTTLLKADQGDFYKWLETLPTYNPKLAVQVKELVEELA